MCASARVREYLMKCYCLIASRDSNIVKREVGNGIRNVNRNPKMRKMERRFG